MKNFHLKRIVKSRLRFVNEHNPLLLSRKLSYCWTLEFPGKYL